MHKAIIVVLAMSVAGLATGCNKAKNEVLPDGTKVFGERTLKDGTKTIERVELPNGVKKFDKTILPDGTEKDQRIEHPNGYKQFEVTFLPDGTQKTERSESPNGDKSFGITLLRDGTMKEDFAETASGQKQFDLTGLPDGTTKCERIEYPNGEKWFDVTVTPDGIQKAGRIEQPNGMSLLDVIQKDGKREFRRVSLSSEHSVAGSAVAKPAVSKSDLQILTVRKHFLTSNMFSPVLTVFNKGNHDLGMNVDWYATDSGADVARGSCFANSLRPEAKAEIDCDPYVDGSPECNDKAG
jgi:hypothetical protein